MAINIKNELREKVNQIKFTFGFFLILSIYFVGFSAMISTTLILFCSYVLGTILSKGYENFRLKEELSHIKRKVVSKEDCKVLKEDIKENSIAVKKFFQDITEYDYFSKIKNTSRKQTTNKSSNNNSNKYISEKEKEKQVQNSFDKIEKNLF